VAKHQRLGAKIRTLRRRKGLSQRKLAERLGISASYLNLIEHDRRPLSAELLLGVADLFELDPRAFGEESDARLHAELAEVFGDPLFENQPLTSTDVREVALSSPSAARAVIQLYRAYRGSRESAQTLAERLSDGMALAQMDHTRLPTEEVSDLIQNNRNYFPALETAAERLWEAAHLRSDDLYHGLTDHLESRLGIRVRIVKTSSEGRAVRRFDPSRAMLNLSESLALSSRNFQIAHQIGLLTEGDELSKIATDPSLTTDASRALCRVAMANYFASAVIMPYEAFLAAAREERYDVELLENRFVASFEQVCHRLTTLRAPGSEGIPFHFVRVDIAGNISKRFSASGIRISRFGACPRWNLHAAFLTPARINVQVSTTTDGEKYFCISRTVSRGARGHSAPQAVQAITLGCQLKYAREMVYGDGVDVDNPDALVPIGSSCRLCDRLDCEQRAFPPLQHPLEVNENVRGISFYSPVRDPEA
jgi:predicted transcriptional regulator/transcriptional regulator with XRE-family HTH domain